MDLDLGGVAQSSSRRRTVDVKRVKAYRTKKEMQHMSLSENFITKGTEKADGPAKEGAMLDGGDMAQVRAITIHQEREEVHASLQKAASFLCLVDELGPKRK